MKSPVALLASFLHDCRRLEPGVKGTDRDIITIRLRFKHEGYSFLSITLPSLGRALDQGLSSGRFACPSSFKKMKNGTLPLFLGGLLCEVFEPSTGFLKQTPTLGVVKLLRELLYMFKKIPCDTKHEDYLHAEAARDFVECDSRVLDQFDPDRLHHLRLVSKLCLTSLQSYCRGRAKFKHGPGAVYEKLTSNQKWNEVIRMISDDHPLSDIVGADGILSSLLENSTVPLTSELPNRQTTRLSARFVSVEKSSTSRRGITIEPVLNQFVQQGLNSCLRSSIDLCPILSQCLSLSDQSKNQHLAMEGSISDKYATIDLKSASELLGLSLVREVFSHLPHFLEDMENCRSSLCEVDENLLELRKFAGMGNALTFPVQSVVFAIISIAAITWTDGLKPHHRNVKARAGLVRVYGDDIIVPTDYSHQVCAWLGHFGLAVNMSKSFLKGNFKESCGVDAYCGVDVTPLYARFQPKQTSYGASDLAAMVSFSNQAWFRGLYRLSDHVKKLVEASLSCDLPLVTLSSSALGWHTRQNVRSIQRWNKSLHRFEFRSYVVKSLFRPDPLDGYPALIKSLSSDRMIDDKSHLIRSPRRFCTRVSKRWVVE